MFINKINSISANNVAFNGYQHKVNDVGETIQRFYYPFDSTKETCEIQFFRVKKIDNDNYSVEKKTIKTVKLDANGTDINIQNLTNLDKDADYAYNIVKRDLKGNIIWEGSDTGTKMKEKDGKYTFRVYQDEAWDGGVLIKDKSGKYRKAKPGEKTENGVQYGYKLSGDFKDDSINQYKLTLVKRNGTTPMVQGSGYLIMPDSYRPGIKYKGFNDKNTGEIYEDVKHQKNMENSIRTFSNRFGGSLAGIEYDIPRLKKQGIKMLYMTPVANGDDVTSHVYWNKNNMQVSPSMGTEENYASFVRKLFASGIAQVNDGTFTSEGIEGIHVQHVLRHGENSQAYYWFRMNGLKDSSLGFGVIPKNKENLRHRLINFPYEFVKQSDGTYKAEPNKIYDKNKKSLCQLYDSSQVSSSQLKLDKPIRIYENIKAGSKVGINTHDDTILSYVFEANPNEYLKRIDIINDLNKNCGQKIDLNTPDGTILAMQFSNFRIDKKTEGGYQAWDANTDMVKMNYGISAYDEKNLMAIVDPTQRQHQRDLIIRGSKEVQDMMIQSAVYRTQKVCDIQKEYVAKTVGKIKNAEGIEKLISEGKLPEEAKVNSTVLNNILNGEYNLENTGYLDKNDITLKALMKLPLDALEFDESVQGTLSTSYFSNRATTDETIGMTRFELLKQKNPHLVSEYANVYEKVNELFENELKQFADSIIKKVNENSNEKLLDVNGNYTEYGRYVVDLVGQDIARYAFFKSLAGDSLKSKILESGELTYDYETLKEATSLKKLGISSISQEEEAKQLQLKMKKGLKALSSTDINTVADSISKRISGTDRFSFRISSALVDRAALGLNWRLDAAKDIMDIDTIRNREADFDDVWNNLINVWSRFTQAVKSVNPHSYLVAEMTNVPDIIRDTFGPKSCPYNDQTDFGQRYNGEPDAMTKFFNETGITSEAAYSYFFTELLTSFSREFETGKGKCDTHDDFRHKLNLLINTRSADYLRNLYTFMGNHDKTRLAHGLAIEMELFHAPLTYNGMNFSDNRNYRQEVMRVMSGLKSAEELPLELKLNIDNLDYYRNISQKAVAQTKLLSESVDEDLKGIATQKDIKNIKEALIDLANGNYLDSKTSEKMTKIKISELSSLENAFKEVLELAKAHGLLLNSAEKDKLLKLFLENSSKLDMNNYLVHGNLKENNNAEITKQNIGYLNDIISATDKPERYCLYTVQIARIIKDSLKGTPNSKVINKALEDFVNKYDKEKVESNSDELKMSESLALANKKNGYAARDFRVALNMAIEQAEFKTGEKIKNKQDIIDTVYQSITEPAMQKIAMIMAFLSGLCGIPTLYAGDELGMSGYEDKTKNIWLQNRNTLPFSELDDKNSRIGKLRAKYRDFVLGAMQNRSNPDLKALNGGTPYMLDVKIGDKNRDQVKERIAMIDKILELLKDTPKTAYIKSLENERADLIKQLGKVAMMMQDGNGEIAISVFNASGINHGNRYDYFKGLDIQDKSKRADFIRKNNIDSINNDNKYVPIQERSELDAILLGAGITLPVGMTFVNANSKDKLEYVVKKIGDSLGIVRKDGKKIIMDGKTAKYGVMTLRKIAFRGRENSGNFYSQKFNFASNQYNKGNNTEYGKKLSLISK